jgi:hypothetical protein
MLGIEERPIEAAVHRVARAALGAGALLVDVRITIPAHRADDFKASLFRFLEGRAAEDADGFAMHHAEPLGAQLIQHVYFASDEAAVAFQRRWSRESRG